MHSSGQHFAWFIINGTEDTTNCHCTTDSVASGVAIKEIRNLCMLMHAVLQDLTLPVVVPLLRPESFDF
jgi:hypothetical protein